MQKSSEILLCPHAFFDVSYEINAWMDVGKQPEFGKSQTQWASFHDNLVQCGVELKYIQPRMSLPDMVFTANGGLVKGKTAILPNFRHPEREGERELFKQWFINNGYTVEELPQEIYFEGEGDALFVEDVLLIGHGLRTSKKAHPIIAEILGVEYVSCDLVDPRFYHLDTCLFYGGGNFVYYQDAFSERSMRDIVRTVMKKAIETSKYINFVNVGHGLAKQFVCNSICLGDTVITPSKDYGSCFLGMKVIYCNMSEFIKAGGAAKCLALLL